jgi:hypothetical protein
MEIFLVRWLIKDIQLLYEKIDTLEKGEIKEKLDEIRHILWVIQDIIDPEAVN